MDHYTWDDEEKDEEENQRGRLQRRLKRVKKRKQIQEGFQFESESVALRMRLVHIERRADPEAPRER
jgi:hypothetical protein